MLLKYTSLYDSVNVRVPELNYSGIFKRNQWKDVSDRVAVYLLKMNEFLQESDFKFSDKDFETPKHFAISRFGALGDLIMLIPVVRFLKKTGHRFTLVTQPQYVSIFKPFAEFEDVITLTSLRKKDYDRVFYLDGVLEDDHSLSNPERLKHRIHLYEEFFMIKIDEYDFSFPSNPELDIQMRGILNADDKQL